MLEVQKFIVEGEKKNWKVKHMDSDKLSREEERCRFTDPHQLHPQSALAPLSPLLIHSPSRVAFIILSWLQSILLKPQKSEGHQQWE